MKVTYSPQTDAVHISFSDKMVMSAGSGDPFSRFGGYVSTEIGESGKIVGIRIGRASEILPPGTVEKFRRTSKRT